MFTLKSGSYHDNRIFLFLFTQLLSLVGGKISHVAIGFWIYGQTHSVMSFSLVLFCSFLPNIISSFVSGPIVDKSDFSRTFGLGDIASAMIMLITAAIVVSGVQSRVYLYMAIFSVSAISALQWVAINAYLPKVLKDEKLAKAVGWLSVATSMASLLATSLASLLISTIGMHLIFVFDAATYLLSAGFVYYVLPEAVKNRTSGQVGSFISDFQAGISYLRSRKEILTLIALFVVFNLVAGINTNLMTPLFLERYSVNYAGYLLGGLGLGSLAAGLIQAGATKLSMVKKNIPLFMMFIFIQNILIGYFAFPLTVILVMFLMGANITLINTSTTLVLQESVAAEFCGRIFATARGLSWITVPISQLGCGLLVDVFFRRFYSGVEQRVFLGNIILLVNLAAALIFGAYIYMTRKSADADAVSSA